jgi:hypothetical protein
MGQELSNLEKISAQEEGRLRDVNVQLDLEEVAGAQLAAANAAELGAQATQQGWQGVTSMGQQAAQFIPLFAKQDVDALGNPISVRPTKGKYALPKTQNTNPFANSSPFVTNPFGIPGL